MADSTDSEGRGSGRARRLLVIFRGFLILLIRRVLLPHGLGAAEQPVSAGTGGYQIENPNTAFEPSDWPLWPVALLYIAILTMLVISCFVLIPAFPTALPDVDRTLRIAPPGPRLQTDPEAEMRHVRAEEEKWLNTYHWIDKRKGIVHIPVAEAMKKLARTGAPGFPERQQ
jgi:hypothetical protein